MNDLPGDKELVIRYLLGNVDWEERDRVDEHSFIDPEYSEYIDGVELELIELYVRKRLDKNQRAFFEGNFLVSQERRERLMAMKAMLRAAPKTSPNRKDEAGQPPVVPIQRLNRLQALISNWPAVISKGRVRFWAVRSGHSFVRRGD